MNKSVHELSRPRSSPSQRKKKPILSMILLTVLTLGSLFAGMIAPFSPEAMDPTSISLPPSPIHIFGTDAMGRDLFTLILYGGRSSLSIGLLGALTAFTIAVVYGTISGIAPAPADHLLMLSADLLMSIPGILLVIFLQAIWGKATYLSLGFLIGASGWMQMAKVVRSEVRRIRKSDFVLAAKLMGGGFWYILFRHMLPNCFPAIMFMAVSCIGSAMLTESTLSFLGLGLPASELSWGSLLSLSQNALLSDQWWLILIPGAVLVTALVCIAELGEYVRQGNTRLHSNL